MSCKPFRLPDGSTAILCGVREPKAPRCSQLAQRQPTHGPRARCPFPTVALCDYPIGKGRTCSAKICSEHRTKAGPDLDHCPAHAGVLTLPGLG